MRELRLAQPLLFDSVVDGPGLRCVIWFQGCSHQCQNCHNPQTHDEKGGSLAKIDDIVSQIQAHPSQQGITISGGEPMDQCIVLLDLLRSVYKLTPSIWLYSGYTLEELTNESHPDFETRMRILSYIDVLVDGPFIHSKKDISLLFRGSTNQRLVDMHQTMWQDCVVLWNA